MADLVALLQELGFGEYEARAYTSLLQRHPVNGYELAKASKIPRANIYLVLQKLEERGAVVRIADDNSAVYRPVPPEELLAAIAHRFEQTVDSARQAMQEMDRPTTELLIGIWPHEARALADDMAQAEDRDVQITTLCMAACAEECGGCRGRVYRNKVVDTDDRRWLLLVPDEEAMLAGEIAANGEASTVRSRQPLLVSMTAWFVRHSVALATMLHDVGEQIEQRLTPQTQAALARIGPHGSQGWLAHMRKLLSTRGPSPQLRPDREM
jgi:predicted transcriptional regulator